MTLKDGAPWWLILGMAQVSFRSQQWYNSFAREARTRSAERTEVHLTTIRFYEHTFCLHMRTIRHTKKGRSLCQFRLFLPIQISTISSLRRRTYSGHVLRAIRKSPNASGNFTRAFMQSQTLRFLTPGFASAMPSSPLLVSAALRAG